MMKADYLNSNVNPVGTDMTGMQHIPISHVCDLDDIKSKDILVEKKLLQVYYTNKGESERVIIDESSTEEIES